MAAVPLRRSEDACHRAAGYQGFPQPRGTLSVGCGWPGGSLACRVVLAVVGTACALPDLDDYQERPLAQTSFLYASDGSLITSLHATEDRVVLRRDQMTQHLRDAIVVIEDRRFYDHHGIDLEAIARAAVMNLAEGEVVEGGSTITQQLVKNLYVGDEDSFARKYDEAALAWQLEDRLSKEQILTRYLNTVYFGQGAYGAQAAARTYFGVDADELSLSQSAVLAGLDHGAQPLRSRTLRPVSARGRRDVVLRLLMREGYIDRTPRCGRPAASRSRWTTSDRRPGTPTRTSSTTSSGGS